MILFSELRGISSNLTKHLVDDMISIFQLNEFENALVQNLSGGNKRKLSSAIAFLGKPSVVVLDEVNFLVFQKEIFFYRKLKFIFR
jgi:ATP-binding cassette, subfamily A (ABC1), member 3